MNKVAIVFPGQGSQYIGMGKKLVEEDASIKEMFSKASDSLNRDISAICFEGPEEALKRTDNAQIGIFLVSIGMYLKLMQTGIKPTVLAGHSLGEITACCASGVIDLETGIKIVLERGRLMNEACSKTDTGMAAVLGLSGDAVDEVISAYKGETVVVANYNCPGQVVISGDLAGIEKATLALKEKGAKRIIPLPVAGAFHSPFMEPSVPKFSTFLEGIDFKDPQIPIILNRTAEKEMTAQGIKENLPLQIKSSVRWVQSIDAIANEIDTIIECGPGKVLTGLIKKTCKDKQIITLDADQSIETIINQERERSHVV